MYFYSLKSSIVLSVCSMLYALVLDKLEIKTVNVTAGKYLYVHLPSLGTKCQSLWPPKTRGLNFYCWAFFFLKVLYEIIISFVKNKIGDGSNVSGTCYLANVYAKRKSCAIM